VTQLPLVAVVVAMTCLIGSYISAEHLGFDFFGAVLSLVIKLFFAPFLLLFQSLNPLAQAFFLKHKAYWLKRIWNFSIDCTIAGVSSIESLLDKIGIVQ
jgi:hypothetical protein